MPVVGDCHVLRFEGVVPPHDTGVVLSHGRRGVQLHWTLSVTPTWQEPLCPHSRTCDSLFLTP